MKFNLSNFFKRNASTMLLLILTISTLLLLGWMNVPTPKKQWNFNAMLSTPTPTHSLDGSGWWNNVLTPTSKP